MKNFDGITQFYLNGWRVETEALRLVAPDGTETVIGERAMAVLGALAEANGQVVTKTQLMEIVWGNVAVTQNSLNQAIKELRQALKDDADNPNFIETIRGKGYRLRQPVEVGGQQERRVATARPDRRRFLVAAGAAVAGAATLSGIAWFFKFGLTRSVSSVSPDGAFRAALETRGGTAQLRVVSVATGIEHMSYEFPAPESLVLAWAPNSTRIAINVTRRTDNDFVLQILSLEGEAPESVTLAKDISRRLEKPISDLSPSYTTSDETESDRATAASTYHLEIDGEQLVISLQRRLVKTIGWRVDNDEPR